MTEYLNQTQETQYQENFSKSFVTSVVLFKKKFKFCLNLYQKEIHGSLTRAGKVRNQTPKVEKLPKKKKLTGRAKMRFLYNKRFVHVVEEQGRRRAGPNSNKNK
ncbi:40S ribosomal protein S30/UBIQUITIN-LIKE PROTEIN FUBI [Anaeramoeba flamelloides]|uniref:40S ribosomal protein S30/UBIQUITIN-LIKE PROTEIN FUBI n=1 Tax=Anaeramoeba flamelloides TaxID=1746091 RepID=A0AAV7ZJ06_9EUKA|nr:40S ribosomal protein S30/UBIQUITIN-LIKE PROTEIN FUBI [Anaeramoeba flamelloides]